MKHSSGMRVKHVSVVAATLGTLSLVGCGGPTTRHWTEDVLLDDGSTVVVERSVAFNETSAWGGGAYNAVETEATLAFTGKESGLPVWSAPLMALLLYRDQTRGGQWVIVATTTSCEVVGERGNPRLHFEPNKPETVYFEFRLQHGSWVAVPLSAGSLGRDVNLLYRYEKPISTRHVTVAFREERQTDSRILPMFRRITAKPDVSCGPTTDTRPRWEAEDHALAALDEKHASAEERARVMQLFAGTRFLYIHVDNDVPASWQPDSDPQTVQVLAIQSKKHGSSGVSADGQVIYAVSGPNMMADGDLIQESYSRRLKVAGLGQFMD